MTIQLSNKIQTIKPSAIRAVMAKANTLKAAGKQVLDLSIGEPDFDTPDFIKEAAIKALREGFTKYTAVDGIPSLKAAIVEKFARENKLDYKPEQVMVSCGGRQCINNLLEAILNPSDEVIIPAPYWVTYPDLVMLSQGKPVFIYTDKTQHFKITPAQLEAAITPKTRLLIINSPSNPSGVAYSREELIALGEVLNKHPHVLIATDDMYEHILWSAENFCNIVNACPELYERTVVMNGASKSYAMTGWRMGYAAGPAVLINAMKTVQTQITANPNSIAQVATEAALRGDQSCVKKMAAAFKERHDYIVKEINQIEGFECLPADGTFYAFPSVEKLMQKLNLKTDIEVAEYLLNEALVAVVPGSAFGTPGYVRLSYATSMQILEKAIQNLKKL